MQVRNAGPGSDPAGLCPNGDTQPGQTLPQAALDIGAKIQPDRLAAAAACYPVATVQRLGHLLAEYHPQAAAPLLPIAQTATQLANLYNGHIADVHCPPPPNVIDDRWGVFVNWEIDLDDPHHLWEMGGTTKRCCGGTSWRAKYSRTCRLPWWNMEHSEDPPVFTGHQVKSYGPPRRIDTVCPWASPSRDHGSCSALLRAVAD